MITWESKWPDWMEECQFNQWWCQANKWASQTISCSSNNKKLIINNHHPFCLQSLSLRVVKAEQLARLWSKTTQSIEWVLRNSVTSITSLCQIQKYFKSLNLKSKDWEKRTIKSDLQRIWGREISRMFSLKMLNFKTSWKILKTYSLDHQFLLAQIL